MKQDMNDALTKKVAHTLITWLDNTFTKLEEYGYTVKEEHLGGGYVISAGEQEAVFRVLPVRMTDGDISETEKELNMTLPINFKLESDSDEFVATITALISEDSRVSQKFN